MKLLAGDAFGILRTLPDESVQCTITSPPYWRLRDYDASGQIGQEDSPQAYVDNLVRVFSEVRRVLKKDGTLWLNLGDSHCSTDKWGGGKNGNHGKHTVAEDGTVPSWASRERKPSIPGVKPKDLLGIPWMAAFALRSAGWYLRSDVIWHKPSAMPEPVRDRLTTCHEHVFLLAKSPKYFFDADAIKEPAVMKPQRRLTARAEHSKGLAGAAHRRPDYKLRDVPAVENQMRNKRDVWTIPPQGYKGAHFAVFPEKLVEICLLAGTKDGDTVLDPFCGSGTTGVVAAHYRREFIGIDINPEYLLLAEARIQEGSKVL